MDAKGTLGLLFDLSFTEFITTRLIKVLYILLVGFAALTTLAFIVSGFAGDSKLIGVVFFILSPVVFLFQVFMARLWCEFIIVAFRISENTARLVEQGKVEDQRRVA